MSEIYVYPQNCDDFTNFGLVGALTPISCVFEEEANGMSEITLEHPIDDFGRYTALITNNLLVVDVPVRTTPEISGSRIVTSVEEWKVLPASMASKAQRTLYKKRSGKKKIKVLPGGTSVTVVNKAESGRHKIKCRYGTGWIAPDGLEFVRTQLIDDNSQSIESVQPAWTVKPQVFRIYAAQKKLLSVVVSARHITYDLLYNLTDYKSPGETTCADALVGIMNNLISDQSDEDGPEFEAYTNLATVRSGINWTRTNPIDALLNPETGLTSIYGASLVRDNWEMYVLHDPGLNRGVTVEYGKNMTGITYSENYEGIATRIIPVGEKKNGEDLLLDGTIYVDSPNIDRYPVVYTQELRCEGCTVGTDGLTTAQARERMRSQAQAVFDAGGDLPVVEMDVDFINLGDTAEYAQFKNLERLFLWDYVLVRHKLLDIDVTSRIVSIRWDCLLERMDGMSIGAVGKTLANTGITTWQIPTGFSGSKIAPGTIGAPALAEDVISARHVQADSINAEAIQADVFTSERASVGSLTAVEAAIAKLEATQLTSSFAEIFRLLAASIQAGDVTAEQIDAQIARLTTLTAGTGDFDLATIQNLLANALVLEKGTAGTMYINNLAVTSANILNVTLGNLVVKGEDGQYYRIAIGTDGVIRTEVETVTDGVPESGGQIVETTINAETITGQTVMGNEGVFENILTAALSAGKITANEAMLASAVIPNLSVSTITAAGNSITVNAGQMFEILLNGVQNMNQWFSFGPNGLVISQPAIYEDDGVTIKTPASIWSTVTDETGYHIRNSTVPGYVGSFYKDRLKVDTIEMGDTLIRKMDDGGIAFFGM